MSQAARGSAWRPSIIRIASWTAPLAKAAFNYQLSRTEPGAWAHNFDYMAELLYDSVADLGGDVTSLTRP